MKKARMLRLNCSTATQAVFSHDNTIFACMGFDEGVLLWDTSSWQIKHKLEVISTRFSAFILHHQNLLTLSDKNTGIEIWNIPQWKKIETIPTPARNVIDIAFSNDGHILATNNFFEQKIEFWSFKAKKPVGFLQGANFAFHPTKSLVSVSNGIQIKSFALPSLELATVNNISDSIAGKINYHPSGELMAMEMANEDIWLWNMTTNKLEYKLTQGEIARHISFSRNGRYIAISHSGFVRVWNIPQARVHSIDKTDIHLINSLSFSSDNKYLACVGGGVSGGVVEVWEI